MAKGGVMGVQNESDRSAAVIVGRIMIACGFLLLFLGALLFVNQPAAASVNGKCCQSHPHEVFREAQGSCCNGTCNTGVHVSTWADGNCAEQSGPVTCLYQTRSYQTQYFKVTCKPNCVCSYEELGAGAGSPPAPDDAKDCHDYADSCM